MKRRHSTSETANAEPAQAPRRNRAAAAGDDALSQGKGALARAGFTDPMLVLRWREIAGADVARVAEPTHMSEGPGGATLTLRCRPGAAVLLQHETRALMERLNGYLGHGRVTRLKLTTGEITALPAPPRHPSARDSGGHDSSIEEPPPDLTRALERLHRRRAKTRAPRAGRGN